MKNFVIALFLSVIFISCEDPNIDSGNKTKEQLLVLKAWQLEKFTNPQGVQITDGSLNSSARMLYGLVIQFEANNTVKGIDKNTKTIVNRGTWDLKSDSTTLDIDIVGFEGNFELININNTTMTLEAKTENRLIGVGPEIYLVFSRFDL